MRNTSRFVQAALVVALAAVVTASQSFGQVITYRKVVDTDTPIPGGSGNFSTLEEYPSLSGTNVSFYGEDAAGQGGVYLDLAGVLGAVADTSTAIPGGSGNFDSFGTASLSGGNVAFRGGGVGQLGIYATAGGSLLTIADLATSIPGGTGNFENFDKEPPSIDAGTIAFVGTGASSQSGVYSGTGGALTVLADTSTPVPGEAGNFTSFDAVSLDGTDIAFRGFSSIVSQLGLYARVGGVFEVAAQVGTPIPGGSGDFSTFGKAAISNGAVAFRAGIHPDYGVYSTLGGSLGVVADITTSVPRANGDFLFFSGDAPSIDGGNVVFQANTLGESQTGIYALYNGSLIKVVDRNDTLDGKTPQWFRTSPEALDGTDVAFHVDFSDGSEGIYVASIPLEVCGNGILEAGELCDSAGEWLDCDADCTPVECGDGTTNVTAGEECDDAGDSADCDADCTLAVCGDGTLNTLAGEVCDDGGDSATCDADCTPAECGDGTRNLSAGELCDNGEDNSDTRPNACRTDCRTAHCGDGVMDFREECDDGAGNSNTAPDACRANCLAAHCGDGVVDSGEECDDGNDQSGDGCSATCEPDFSEAIPTTSAWGLVLLTLILLVGGKVRFARRGAS